MPFTTHSAGAKYNSGASREQMDKGYETLDPNADNAIFRQTQRNPKSQGWRATDAYVNHDDKAVTGGSAEDLAVYD